MDFGILSLLPAIIAIVLALTTKEVILSLFLAVFAGASLLSGNLITGLNDTLNTYIVGSLTDSWNVAILLFCLSIGGLIQLIEKNGGTKSIANLLVKRAVSTKSALLTTWFLGIAIFFDDYANSLIVGNAMRSVTDRMKISREKLAYIVDSTAAPISSMALISTWIGMELGLIQTGLDAIGYNANAYGLFLSTIPYRFYSVLALAFVGMIIITGRDYGPMAEAERKAQLSKMIVEAEEENPEFAPNRLHNAVIPLLTVILITMVGLYHNGGGFEGAGIRDAFANADASVVLFTASIGGFIVAALMTLAQRQMSLVEIMNTYIEGIKTMVTPGLILILAWSLGSVNGDLGTASYIVGFIGEKVPPFLIPLLMFIVPALIAFATGTSWGANSLVMPIAIVLAYETGGPALLVPTIGAVLTGAVFGDHISPISDTTVMSSMASGCDHIAHVRTQIPYALTVASASVLFGFIPAGFGINPWLSLGFAMGALYLFLRCFGEKVQVSDQNVHTDVAINSNLAEDIRV